MIFTRLTGGMVQFIAKREGISDSELQGSCKRIVSSRNTETKQFNERSFLLVVPQEERDLFIDLMETWAKLQ